MNLIKKIVSVIGGLICLMLIKSLGSELFRVYVRSKTDGSKEYIFDLILFILFAVIPTIVLIRFIWRTRCSHCKKFFVLKKVETQKVGSEDISVKMRTKRYDNDNKVVGTQEQYIPGQRIRYRVTYECVKCGEDTYRRYSKDYANV